MLTKEKAGSPKNYFKLIGLEVSNKEKLGKKHKEEILMWNVGKRSYRRACENLMKLSMYGGAMETVFIERWVPFER